MDREDGYSGQGRLLDGKLGTIAIEFVFSHFCLFDGKLK